MNILITYESPSLYQALCMLLCNCGGRCLILSFSLSSTLGHRVVYQLTQAFVVGMRETFVTYTLTHQISDLTSQPLCVWTTEPNPES